MTTKYGNVASTSGYTEAFYNSYQTGYEHILQEMTDIYAGKLREDRIEGENRAYDFLGTIDLEKKETRFEDIPIEDMEHNRRWLYPEWYRKGIFVDDEDQIVLHTDPTSDYLQALGKGVLRTKNTVTRGAFFGNVKGGKNPGDLTYSFKNEAFSDVSEGGRTIVHDTDDSYSAGGTSAGLTVEKLIMAREALELLDNDPNSRFYIAVSPKQISDLLREAETQSIDTNIVRALYAGTINEYMGFTFVKDNGIKKGTNNDADEDTDVYELPVWTSEGMLFAGHQSPIFNVDWLPRKQIWQLSARAGMNAIRMDEDKVLKIECI